MTQIISGNFQNFYMHLKIQMKSILEELNLFETDELEMEFWTLYERIISDVSIFPMRNKKLIGSATLLAMFCKTKLIPLNIMSLTSIIRSDYKDITKLIKELIDLYPEYKRRDRLGLIQAIIRDTLTYFKPDDKCYSNALLILRKYYPYLKTSREEIVAGIVCILTVYAMDLDVPHNQFICQRIGIRSSSVHNGIKRRIVDVFGLKGFISLRASAHIIKNMIRTHLDIAPRSLNLEILEMIPKKDIPKYKQYEKKIICLKKSGASLAEIARSVGVSYTSVKRCLKENNISLHRISFSPDTTIIDKAIMLRKQYWGLAKIGKELGLTTYKIRRIFLNHMPDYRDFIGRPNGNT